MLRSSLLVTFLTLGASALGFAVQLLIAQRFAVGVAVDTYLFSLSLPTFLAGVISAMLSFNLIPRLVSAKNDIAFHHNLAGSLMIYISAVSIFLIIAMYGVMYFFIDYLLPAKSPIRQYRELNGLVLLSCMVGGAQVMQGCVGAMLNSEKKYIHSAMIALLPSAGMLALLLGMDESTGIKPVTIGLLSGTILAVFTGMFILKKYLFPLAWKEISWSELRNLATTSSYTALAMSCFSAYSIVDAFWGPRAGDGALASLGYAQRLVIAVGNLAVAGPSAVLVPHLAEYLRDQNYRGFLNLMNRAFLLVGAIAILAALLMGIFSFEIVKLLFGRGDFGPDQVSEVANTITNMTPGMTAMLLSVIGLRVLFCFEAAHKEAAALGLGWTIGYFCASSLAHKHGPPAIAVAYSSIWIITFCIISILIYKRTRKFNASQTN
jgi:putative peptidoglycan lipid II flippase